MFILSLIVFSIFAVITYNTEKELLHNNAKSEYIDLINTLNLHYYTDEEMSYLINQKNGGNIQIKITNAGALVSETGNTLYVTFHSDDRQKVQGVIDYRTFIDSISLEQFQTIKEYLTAKPNSKEEYYELICTEYYIVGGGIIPKTIEVVLTRGEHDWYVQDTPVESFSLSPITSKNPQIYKIWDCSRNVIDIDFFLGKYARKELISQVEILYSTNGYYPDASALASKASYKTAPLNYIFYATDTLHLANDDYYNITYAYEYNVLESCMDKIGFMFAYILVLFIITGIIIGTITWHTLKKQIVQENKLRTVTNSMAHELKTPLFVIGGYAESLAENINRPDGTEYASVITKETNAMNQLISKMLDYSKLDSQNYLLNYEKFNLTEFAKEIAYHYTEPINIISDDKAIIKADKKLISCVIDNLISNAVKYSTDSSKIIMKIEKGVFSISNPCETVTKSELRKMWEPYYRSNKQSHISGHGLGLAIVKSILDLHKFKSNSKYENNNITIYFHFS